MMRSFASPLYGKRRMPKNQQVIRRISNQQFIFRGEEYQRAGNYFGAASEGERRNARSARHEASLSTGGTAAVKVAVPAVPVLSKTGIRSTIGWKMMFGIFVLMSTILLFKVGQFNAIQNDTALREQTRNQLRNEQVSLTNALSSWKSSAQVGYEAVKLGMVDSKGVKRVVITLP